MNALLFGSFIDGGIFLGNFALAVFFLAVGGGGSADIELALWSAWLYGGPLLAALSCLRRLYRREPTPSPPGASPSSGG